MRPISSDLKDVQKVRSPRARVTCTVEARSPHGPQVPAVAWAELVPNTGQTSFPRTALVALENGAILKFVAGASHLQQYTIADPTTAAGWTGASPTNLLSGLFLSVAALRVPGGAVIRLFYINAANNVLYIESANNGASWSSPVTVYSGGDAADDLVLAYIADGIIQNGPWFVGFSTYNSGTGEYTARFGYHDGVAWTSHAYAPGWRAAGIDAYGNMAAHRVYVFRQLDAGPSRLRALHKSGAAYSDAQDIDQTQAGRFGLHLAAYRFFQLAASQTTPGCMLGLAVETAYNGAPYLGVCGLFYHDDPLIDETIILPAIATADDGVAPALVEAGGSLYLAGDTVVYRGAPQPAAEGVLTPIRYLYDDHQMELDFPGGGATPALAVGQVLVVARELSWGEQRGVETLRVLIVRVEQGTDLVRVLAVDAVGYLGLARCRRPSILNDGSVTGCGRVARRLCARFGIPAHSDDSAIESAPVLPFTLQPAESLLGALYRVTSQTNLWVVPANDGSFGVTLITPPNSDASGHYADTPHIYGAGQSQQPLIRAAAVSDYRRLAFAYVFGSFSTDPEDGGTVAMAAGPALPNTRPLSYSLTNQRYNNSTRVQRAATSEAARQRKLPVDAIIEAQANLALELYDVVEVTEPALGWNTRRLRVRRIAERWAQGRLTQTIYCGEE